MQRRARPQCGSLPRTEQCPACTSGSATAACGHCRARPSTSSSQAARCAPQALPTCTLPQLPPTPHDALPAPLAPQRGLGKALAREFLANGDRVLVTARSPEAVAAAVDELRAEAAAAHATARGAQPKGDVDESAPQVGWVGQAGAACGAAGGLGTVGGMLLAQAHVLAGCGGEGAWRAPDRAPLLAAPSLVRAQIVGFACDVSDPAGLAGLKAAAVAALGRVDAWVNNAGYSGSFQSMLDQSDEQITQASARERPGPQRQPWLRGWAGTRISDALAAHRRSRRLLTWTPVPLLGPLARRWCAPTCWARCCAPAPPSRSSRASQAAGTCSTWTARARTASPRPTTPRTVRPARVPVPRPGPGPGC
jgi:NAD(P)-dependent dehydrogenase (short-subunit alcohol dehydrogenase family)